MLKTKQYKGVICIYKMTSPTGKVYIGQTWDLGKRYKSGVSKGQRLLWRSYEKHGEDAHSLELLKCFDASVTQKELDKWEVYYIQEAKDAGLTLLNIRGGGWGGKASEETKLLFSEAQKRRVAKDPEKARQLAINMSQGNIGSKRTEETRNLMSKSMSGKVRTDTHSQNISKAKTGKSTARKGQKYTEQALENIRFAAKHTRVMTTLRPVKQFDLTGNFIKEYKSIREAALFVNIAHGVIAACVRKDKHALTAAGFIWRYSEDTEPIDTESHKQRFNPKRCAVIKYDKAGNLLAEYESVKAAHDSNPGSDRTGIIECCRGRQKSSSGFVWQYKN